MNKWLSAFAVGAALLSPVMQARAEYPDHAIHILIGFVPGGGSDLGARVVAGILSEKFGQPVVVENKVGATGTIAADITAHSKPDGYTLFFTPASHTITPSLMKLNYDPVADFAPVRQVILAPDVIMVAGSSPIKTLRELIDMAKAKPGVLNFGDAGSGVAPYLEMVALQQTTGTKFTHVAYKGGNEAALAVVGGEVQTSFGALGSVLGQIKGGQLRALGVATTERVPLLPEIPTIAEALGIKSFDAANSDWLGLIAPANTPREIVDKLNSVLTAAVNTPEIQAKFLQLGFVTVASNKPDRFAKIIKDDIARWAPMLKDEGKKD